MKIIKLIPFENLFFGPGQFTRFHSAEKNDDSKFIVFENKTAAGYISISENEIRNMTFRRGVNEKYLLDKTLRILSSRASAKRMIRLYVYSDTDHIPQLEKLGFIKRKRFFDDENNKYFKMFKIV